MVKKKQTLSMIDMLLLSIAAVITIAGIFLINKSLSDVSTTRLEIVSVSLELMQTVGLVFILFTINRLSRR